MQITSPSINFSKDFLRQSPIIIAKSSPGLISGTPSNGDMLTEPCIKFLPFLPNLGLLPRALLNRS